MTPLPIIIDCDPGVDDSIALLLALASPKLDVRGVTTVSGNVSVEKTARNALQIVELAGRGDVPVHAGCARALLAAALPGHFHGATGLGTTVLPEPKSRLAAGHAVTFLAREIGAAMARGAPITLCTLGPMTNIAVLLRTHPELQPGIARIVAMGGAYREPGNRTMTSEFNVLADPHAAEIVFSSGIPMVSVPLDATHQVIATPERAAAFRDLPGPVGRVFGQFLAHWDRNDPVRYGSRGGPLHDPLVPAYLIEPGLFGTERAAVFVEHASPLCYGQTVADWYGKSGKAPWVDVVMRVDADGVFAMLREHMLRYKAV